MNKYVAKFNEMQAVNARNEMIASLIIKEVEKQLGFTIEFDKELSCVNRLFQLMNTNLINIIYPLLDKYNYNYHAQLQYIIPNLCFTDDVESMSRLPSVNQIIPIKQGYEIWTKLGRIRVYKANLVFKGIDRYIIYKHCHMVCEQFIRDYNNVSASTCLMDKVFEGKHMHSFINYQNYALHLSFNALLSKEDNEKAFCPIVWNTVNHDEIDAEEKRIEKVENLGSDYALLLRLAFDKKMKS